MKVKDLILELQKLDQDEEILTYNNVIEEDEEIEGVFQNDDGTYYL